MADIYEWLENTNQPMDGIFTDDPMDQVMPLGIDKDGNAYFDMPHAWDASFEQPPVNIEPFPIDPSLYTETGPSAPTTLGRTFVMVPEEFAEVSSKILIYFAKVLDILETPKDMDNGLTKGMVFTTDELETLELIAKEDFELLTPRVIHGICVNQNPQSAKIKDVIDLHHIGPNRQSFYLARTIEGDYYWFHIPHAEHDHQLRQLIGDYHHMSDMEADSKKACSVKRLRNGKTVRI